MPDTARDYLWKRYSDLRYRVELSALYHRKRERFLECSVKSAWHHRLYRSLVARWRRFGEWLTRR